MARNLFSGREVFNLQSACTDLNETNRGLLRRQWNSEILRELREELSLGDGGIRFYDF